MSIQAYGNSSLISGFSGFCPVINSSDIFSPAVFQLALPWYESKESWRSRVEDTIQNYQTLFCNVLTLSDPAVASLVDKKISVLANENANLLTQSLAAFTAGACVTKQWKLCTVGGLVTSVTHLFVDSLSTLMRSFYSRESEFNDFCTGEARLGVKPRIKEMVADRIRNKILSGLQQDTSEGASKWWSARVEYLRTQFDSWSELQEMPKGELDFDQIMLESGVESAYLDKQFDQLRSDRDVRSQYFNTHRDQMMEECEEIMRNHKELFSMVGEKLDPYFYARAFFMLPMFGAENDVSLNRNKKSITHLLTTMMLTGNYCFHEGVVDNELNSRIRSFCHEAIYSGTDPLEKEMDQRHRAKMDEIWKWEDRRRKG